MDGCIIPECKFQVITSTTWVLFGLGLVLAALLVTITVALIQKSSWVLDYMPQWVCDVFGVTVKSFYGLIAIYALFSTIPRYVSTASNKIEL